MKILNFLGVYSDFVVMELHTARKCSDRDIQTKQLKTGTLELIIIPK